MDGERCSDCGGPSIVFFAIDGTTDRLCFACVKEARDVGEMHAYAIRIHDAAHGRFQGKCPKCAELAMWGYTQREGPRYDR